MKQISIFFRCSMPWQSIRTSGLALLISIVALAQSTIEGQSTGNEFDATRIPAASRTAAPVGNGWTTPPFGTPNAGNAPPKTLPRRIGNAFPEQPIHFDPGVQPAEYTVGAPSIPESNAVTSPATGLTSSAGDIAQQMATGLQAAWQQGNWSSRLNAFFGGADVGRMLGSLALVLGGYFAVVWISRRWNPSPRRQVPREVLEVLESIPFEHGKRLQMVRLGSKLLLLIHGPDSTQPIGEITDPEEVQYLTSLCSGRQKATRDQARQIRRAASAPAAPATPPVASAPVASGTGNHLASILNSLNGPHGNQGAVFEA